MDVGETMGCHLFFFYIGIIGAKVVAARGCGWVEELWYGMGMAVCRRRLGTEGDAGGWAYYTRMHER